MTGAICNATPPIPCSVISSAIIAIARLNLLDTSILLSHLKSFQNRDPMINL